MKGKSRTLVVLFLLLVLAALSAASDDSTGAPSAAALTKVSKLSFTGNRTFSSRELKSLQLRISPGFWHKADFSFSGLRRDTLLIAQFYRSNGFLKVKLQADTSLPPDTSLHRLSVTIRISEGPRTRISGVRITGVPPAYWADISKLPSVRAGLPLIQSEILKDLQSFSNWLGDRGHLEASATSELGFSADSLSAEVHYLIAAGPVIRVASIRILGLKEVSPGVVRERLDLKENAVLTRAKLGSAVNNLYSSNLFSFVTLSYDSLASSDSAAGSSRVLRVQLMEARFFTGTLGVGYQTYEQVRGRLELAYRNFFGLGIRGYGIGYANFINQGGELGSTFPWLFNLPLDYNTRIYYRNQNEPRIHLAGVFYGWNNTLAYQVSEHIRFSLNHRLETSRLTMVPPVLPENVGAPFTHSLGLEAARDSRDDLFDPHHGSYTDAMVERSGLLGKSSNQFTKFEVDGRIYFPLGTSWLLASAIYGGIAVPYGASPSVPVQERFYLGGPNVMRGFADKTLGPDSAGTPTGGTLYLACNVMELRFPIYKMLWGDVFLDAGNLWDIRSQKLADYSSSLSKFDLQYNPGAGLRLHLPVIIASFDAGFNFTNSSGKNNFYALHFKVGNSF